MMRMRIYYFIIILFCSSRRKRLTGNESLTNKNQYRRKTAFHDNLRPFLTALANSTNPKGNPVGGIRDFGISGFCVKKRARAREKVTLAFAGDTCSIETTHVVPSNRKNVPLSALLILILVLDTREFYRIILTRVDY